MISRARIVVAESDGVLTPLHASFNALAALDTFKAAAQGTEYTEVALIENGVITRIARPRKPTPPPPRPLPQKTESDSTAPKKSKSK